MMRRNAASQKRGRQGDSKQRQRARTFRRLNLEPLEDRRLLAVRVWDGGGADALWTNPANWVGDVTPMADDNLVFPTGLAAGDRVSQNDFLAGTRFRTITISDSGYNITGNSIVLAEGFVDNQVGGTSTFNVPMTLGGSLTIQTSNAGATLLLGSIDTGNLLTATFDGAGNTQVGDGGSVAGVISGGGGISKYGSGNLILYGNNTYEGLTLIRQGAINIRSNNALGAATGPTDIGSWSSLEVQSNITVPEPLYIANCGQPVRLRHRRRAAQRQRQQHVDRRDHHGPQRQHDDLRGRGQHAGHRRPTAGARRRPQPAVAQVRRRRAGAERHAVERLQRRRADLPRHAEAEQVRRGAGAEPPARSGSATTICTSRAWAAATTPSATTRPCWRSPSRNQFADIDFLGVNMLTLTLHAGGKVQFAPGVSQTIGHLVLNEGAAWSSDIDVNGGTLTVLGNVTLNAQQGSSGGTKEGTFDGSPAARIYSSLPGGKLDLGTNWSGIGGGPPTLYRTWTINDTALTSINPGPGNRRADHRAVGRRGLGQAGRRHAEDLGDQHDDRPGLAGRRLRADRGGQRLRHRPAVDSGAVRSSPTASPHTVGNTLVGMDSDFNVFSFPGQTGS